MLSLRLCPLSWLKSHFLLPIELCQAILTDCLSRGSPGASIRLYGAWMQTGARFVSGLVFAADEGAWFQLVTEALRWSMQIL